MPAALISGANKGLGLATARLLSARGCHVWLGSRCVDAGSAAAAELRAAGGRAEAVALDITDGASVEAAAQRIADATGLDILVNNAAIMDEGHAAGDPAGRPGRTPLDALERTMATNFLGTLRVIRTFLPLLLRSPQPRIVNVSSRLGSFGHQTDPQWPGSAVGKLGYSSSKAALNMATVLIAHELRDTGVKVNAVTPGIIATDLNGEGADALRGRPGFAPPAEGAELVARYALLPADGPTGRFFGPGGDLPW
ncbi:MULTISPECIES: SDR family NAD(P)-dependent oxidoreductase [unclassified Sphingobium]|uniref:SDR family NAD(P)-dependent oxidoreductase n=1 Tax=unclassified Sphingobium TaxID=2611147 RepID=UPI0035A66CA2